jgi:hypothetical protein
MLRIVPGLLSWAMLTIAAAGDAPSGVLAANFNAEGQLLRPTNLETWVFLGAGLGMDYSGSAFSVEHPGPFQIVLMEPAAYAYFREHGRYADGTLLLLSFYGTQHAASIDRKGFALGDLNNFEIHMIDRTRFAKEGRAFFAFGKNDMQSKALPAGSPCVLCHQPNGAFDGTFAQFYPSIRERIAAHSP